MSFRAAILSDLKAEGKTGTKRPVSSVKQDHKPLEALLIKQKLDNLFYFKNGFEEVRYGLHASAIIASENEFCIREQVLSLFFKQQGEHYPINLMRIFAQGTAIHEKWQNMFIKAGIAFAIEKRCFSEEYELYFTPDAIIYVNGKKYVVEIKSMNTFSFQKATTHPSGRKQLLLYMHLLGIRQGFVLMEDKNNQDYKIEMVDYNYEEIIEYIDRLNDIQKLKKIFLEENDLPPKKCKNCETKRAKTCNMLKSCFSLNGGREFHQNGREK